MREKEKIENCICGFPGEILTDNSIFKGCDFSDRYPEVAKQYHGYQIRCPICGIQTCFWHYKTEAIESWNKIFGLLKQEREAKKELLEALNEIPCLCHDAYKARNLRDPQCPRCNWVDKELIDKYTED